MSKQIPFDKDMLKIGYFILYQSGQGWFGKQIVKQQLKEGFTQEQAIYTHVECSGGELDSINVAPPRAERINIIDVHSGRYAKVVRFKKYSSDNKRYKVAYFNASLNGSLYDAKGIMAFLAKRVPILVFLTEWLRKKNRFYFCSEASAWALQKSYPKAFNGFPPTTIFPADFLDPKQFEPVWEGYLPKRVS